MRKVTIAAAALIAATPLVPMSSASAQGQDAAAERTAEDDRDIPWGLLGLLGLAGLLGRKRDDRDHVRRTHTDGTSSL